MNQCRITREAIQDRLDGPVLLERHREIEDHLRICVSCRVFEEDLLKVRDALRKLPEVALPERSLNEVWSRTLRAQRAAGDSYRRWRLLIVGAAAAAVVTIAFLPALFRQDGRRFDAAELARGERDAHTALVLAARALQRSERVVVDRVLLGQLSPALRRIPIRWSAHSLSDSRRSKT